MRKIFSFLALSTALLLGRSAQAATFTVTNINDTGGSCAVGDCSLRQAINSAQSQTGADTITFASGLNGVIFLNDTLPLITSDMAINAPADTNVTLEGRGLFKIANLQSGTVSISGLAFNGGYSGFGGAIQNQATSLTLSDCTFTNNNSIANGGALENEMGSFLAITRCSFISNVSASYGGAIMNLGTAVISNSTFSANRTDVGGAISSANNLTLNSCTIISNGAEFGGGIESGGTLWMTNCIVAGNTATIANPDLDGTVNSGDYNLVQNTAGATLSGTHNITGVSPNLVSLNYNGGRTLNFALQAGSPALDAGLAGGSDQRGLARPFDTPGVANVANGADMGAVEQGATTGVQSAPSFIVTNNTDIDDGTCTASDCSLREAVNAANSAVIPSSITFDATAFASPQTIAIGSTFPSLASSATITGSAAGVTINSAAKQSGFQVTSGTINLFDLTITGDGNNFGVQNSSPGANLTVRGCTFTGNFNAIQQVAGTAQVQNSTFSGNTRGILSTTDFTLANSTISSNFTGLYLNGATVTPTIANSIIASNNTPISNNNGSNYTADTYSLIGVTNAQAGLSSAGLQNNGGPTKTIAVVSGPALNGGDPAFDTAALPTDQRGEGYPRKTGSAIDIGAFEAQPPTNLTLTNSTVLENQPVGTYVGSFQTTDSITPNSFTYAFATGLGDTDNTLFSINAAGSLRTAATFNVATQSSYSILVSTTNAAGLSLTRQFTITVLEATPPTVTIANPTANQKLLLTEFTGNSISGTASDNVGVTSVKVRLSRKRNNVNQFWNGTNFVTVQTLLNATVTTVGDPNVTWTLAAPPQNKLDAGLYSLQVYATDTAGNKSAYVDRTFPLFQDLVAPTVAISTPTASQVVDINDLGAGSLTGTASDDTAVTSVKIKLQRKRGNVTEYWNGTDFTPTVALVDATYASGSWSYATPIPANKLDKGGYTFYATAYDAAGNFKTSPSRIFYITGNVVAPDAPSVQDKSAGAS